MAKWHQTMRTTPGPLRQPHEAKPTVTRKNGDESIAGIVKEDRLSSGAIYYQAKCWDPSRTVGRSEIQKFVGPQQAREPRRASSLLRPASRRIYAETLYNPKIVLVGDAGLVSLMIDCNVGVNARRLRDQGARQRLFRGRVAGRFNDGRSTTGPALVMSGARR